MSRYQIYTIKNTANNKLFVGLTSGESNMLTWILRKVKTDPESYQKLQESVKVSGRNKHAFQRTNKVFDTKEEGEIYLRAIHQKLEQQDMLLNDSVIEIERYTCEHCQKRLKVIYKAKHDEMYCTKSTNDLLDSLLAPQVIDPELGF